MIDDWKMVKKQMKIYNVNVRSLFFSDWNFNNFCISDVRYNRYKVHRTRATFRELVKET